MIIDEGIENIEINFRRKNTHFAVIANIADFVIVFIFEKKWEVFLGVENMTENIFLGTGRPKGVKKFFTEGFLNVFLVTGNCANRFILGGENNLGEFF